MEGDVRGGGGLRAGVLMCQRVWWRGVVHWCPTGKLATSEQATTPSLRKGELVHTGQSVGVSCLLIAVSPCVCFFFSLNTFVMAA